MKFKLTLCLVFGAWICLQARAFAHDSLPTPVLAQAGVPLKAVGEGTYKKFGFSIYHAVLWAPDGMWNPDKPYALELHYLRSLSKDTLADATVDNIRDENTTDEDTMTRWAAGIKRVMPAVQDGDVMIGLIIPNKEGFLFMNGVQIGKTYDNALSKAFLNIWLGEDADEDLKNELLSRKTD
ncbi:MAG: chalcone isomerase family protein [Alphaproteobacteria bacterium]